jgi:xylan 1,4-beta-xylosidase
VTTETMIRNPVLPGFHPDPSICRAGEEFYIATSTFEWFPGVEIHHSRDLVHWRLITRPLTRVSQLDMRGNPDSGGIWAPCLTHANGRFWLVYTDVKNLGGPFKDTPNYLVTAERIEGPWSEPVFLNAGGFDPSLFHDDDGRTWLVNMVWDHRPGANRFGGILLQQYDVDRRQLVGPIRNIFRGSPLGVTEGPHLYKKDGWYYLMTAEGGTGYEHAVTLARSKDIAGPFEVQPDNPVLTAHGHPDAPLQKAGHGSLVDTPSGEWYMAHLCSRPITEHRRCPLGRETALQKVRWSDEGWLTLDAGDPVPPQRTPAPNLPPAPHPPARSRVDFDTGPLDGSFQSLREPMTDDWVSMADRPGWLRLIGRHSLGSTHRQSLIARRIQAFRIEASTWMDAAPESFQQMAGLVAYYNTRNWAYLHVTADEQIGRCLRMGVCDNGRYDEPVDPIRLPASGPVGLRLMTAYETGRFSWSAGGDRWEDLPETFDVSKLSDDYVAGWGFTGAFVGLCCQDLTGRHMSADFDWFEYRELG